MLVRLGSIRIKKGVCLGIIIQFILLPVSSVLIGQVTEDNTAPMINHLPIKTGIQGQTIPVFARVVDDSEVGTVSVNYKKAGKFLDLPIKMVKTGETGTMKIKVTVEACYVFSGPGMYYDTLAVVTEDMVFDTFEEEKEKGFYHIQLAEEGDAWISYAHTDPVVSGAIYSGVIPSTATIADELVYRISAEDIHHNMVSTLPYTIRLMKPDEAKKTQDGQTEPPTDQVAQELVKPRPFYKSPLFLGVVGAAVVGGVVAASSGGGDGGSSGTGSIKVNGSW